MHWWPFTPSELCAALWGAPYPDGVARRDEAASAGPTWWGVEEPSAVEVALLEIVYRAMATATSCAQCGAALGRGLEVDATPTLLRSVRWRVSVRTRCQGWRRHRHDAAVGQSLDGIVLGPFRRRS